VGIALAPAARGRDAVRVRAAGIAVLTSTCRVNRAEFDLRDAPTDRWASGPRKGSHRLGAAKASRSTISADGWPWMILVDLHDDADDVVFVVAVHDGRSGGAATTGR
jgi:hypothetical protein